MAGTRNVPTSNFKQFEEGQDVKIERGKNKGTVGTCVGFDEETGRVEIELANGSTIFAANGTVNWVKNEFYNAEEYDVDEGVEPEEGDVIVYGEQDLSGVEFPAMEMVTNEDGSVRLRIGATSDTPDLDLTFTEEGIAPTAEAKPVAPKKMPKPCQCGCGELASKGKMFIPGHDQRHKGNLIRIMQAGGEGADAAEEELKNRKWRTENEILQLKSKAKPKGGVSATAFVEMLGGPTTDQE